MRAGQLSVADLFTPEALQVRLNIPLRLTNVRPIIRLAATLAGSGPKRVKMVKLFHELNRDVDHL